MDDTILIDDDLVSSSDNESSSLLNSSNNHNNDYDDRKNEFNMDTQTIWEKLSNKYTLYQIYSISLSILFLIVAIILPFVNKKIFSSYDYPVTGSFLQTLGASVLLLILNVIMYLSHRNDLVPKSNIFDQNFLMKSLVMIPVSVCFAIVISLTNIGLSMIPVNYHVVFKSTNIVWIVLFSFIVHKERPSPIILVSIVLLMAGTILTSLEFSKKNQSTSFWPIFINILAIFFESVTLVVLKWTCKYLHRKDSTISALEITFYKVAEGTIVILIPLFAIEGVRGFGALNNLPASSILMLLAGVVVTMVYQGSTVGMIKTLYVTTVGVINQVIIIPQLFLSMAIYHSFSYDALHIVGVVLSVLGCVVFAGYQFYAANNKNNKPDALGK
ncbi:hypothetical protein SAMD00019534_096630, partial [Acytostelium subglobosum LB1]|uniref:hypothetical protein n=1 Tax=Acytostelium subglobosum LB1 TaxID=1410327 RepID=UPI0006449495